MVLYIKRIPYEIGLSVTAVDTNILLIHLGGVTIRRM